MLRTLSIGATLILIFISPVYPLPAQRRGAQESVNRAENKRVEALLHSSVRNRLSNIVQSSKQRILGASGGGEIRDVMTRRVSSQFPSAGALEIEALVLVVMFELWEEEEADLRELIEEMHRMNAVKKAQREYVDDLRERRREAGRKIREECEELKGSGIINEDIILAECNARRVRTRNLLIEFYASPRVQRRKAATVPNPKLTAEINKAERCLGRLDEFIAEISLLVQNLRESVLQTDAALSDMVRTVHGIPGDVIKKIR